MLLWETDKYVSEKIMDDQVFNEDEMNGLSGHAPDAPPAADDSEPVDTASGSADSEQSSASGWQERQLEAVQVRYQGICAELAAELQHSLGTDVKVRAASVQVTTVGEFILGMEMPTCLNVLRAEPLQSPWLLEIESAVLFPIISRLLGGGNQVSTLERRTATEIELHLMQQITERFLAILQRAWSGALDCTFSLERVETNPRRMQGLAPRDELVLVQLEISFDDVRGSWRQGLPLSALRSSRAPLAQGVLQEADTNDAVMKFDAAHPQQMTGQTHLRALLAQMKISPADFAELAEGDILRTPIEADDGFRIYLDGEPKFMARAGTMQGYKAIEIQQVLKPSSPQDETEQA